GGKYFSRNILAIFSNVVIEFLATVGQTQNVYAAVAYNQGGASHGQNPPPAYQAPAYQAPGYQAPVQQALIPQLQVVTTTEFTNYMKANDAILKNMQTNMNSLINSNLELKNMFGQFMKMNTSSYSGSRTLPSNTITNPKENLKGITTRSGITYKGPTIPTTSFPPKVVERKTEVIKDTVPPTNNGSTKDIQPPIVQIETQIPISEPVVAPVVELVKAPISAQKPNPKPLILYPSFLKTRRALIDVYEGELTIRVGNKAVTFNVNQTSRYSANYDAESINRIDDLPPHLEYAFLEGDDKLPVMLAKDLKDKEKTALIKVLKSHKQALAWKLFDIKGINPEFCTHKILMKDDFKPAIQHQRRVNPKIYEVIKKEVLQLLDARLIYPISNSPWVSPVHCVPKKVVLPFVRNIITSLADKAILLGADNHPPMLEKDMYDSWKSRMCLSKENGVTIPKKYTELSAIEAIQADCDVKATNIILQGLPPEVYALESTHKVVKELWERIQMLMQGTSLTKQERELNIKFLNTLPPEWSKFVTDVKLVRDMHTTNVDQLHAYLGQHEYHANEVRIIHERTSDPLVLVANHQMNKSPYQPHPQSYHQHQFQPQVLTFQSSQYGTQYHSSQYASQAQSSTPLSITYPLNDFQSSVNHNVYNPSSSIP
nr:reverse transcriptase domain-containing protein [Tanacetum cinerariifolium]